MFKTNLSFKVETSEKLWEINRRRLIFDIIYDIPFANIPFSPLLILQEYTQDATFGGILLTLML